MVTFDHAGFWLDSLTNDRGDALKLTEFTLTAADGSAAVIYADANKTPAQSNVLHTDIDGNASFWAEPGIYTLTVPSTGRSFLLQVSINAEDFKPTTIVNTVTDTSGAVTAETTRALAAERRIANPTSWGELAGVRTWQQVYDSVPNWQAALSYTWAELTGVRTWQAVYDSGKTWADALNYTWETL